MEQIRDGKRVLGAMYELTHATFYKSLLRSCRCNLLISTETHSIDSAISKSDLLHPSNLDLMASNQNQASFQAGEIKARAEEKSGQMMDATKDKAGQATEAAKQKAGEAKDWTAQTAQAAMDRAVEGKDQTGSFLGEQTEAAKQKAGEAAQYTQDRASDAAQFTTDSAVAGKDNTGSVLQQAGEQVVNAVVGAKDAVVNTLGMGGDNTGTKDTTGSATEKTTGDH